MQRLPAEEYAKAEVWEKMWNEKTPPFWHKPEVHSELVKQYSDWTAGRKALRLLVPLCGKSVDLLWLADRGHTVIGVELVEKPVQEFFTENNLAYEVKNEQTSSPTEPVLKVYCSINKADKDITIYVCDIFQFINSKPMDKFDGIWDRGSLIAMILSEGDRAERYVQGLLAMLAPDGRYLAESIRHDEGEDESNNEMNAPNMTEEYIKELFGDRCNLRQVDIKFLDKDPEAKGRPQMAHSMIYHIITFNQ